MSASEPAIHSIVDPDHEGCLRVNCYVRSAVPPAVSERIRTIIERLRTLRDHGFIDDIQVDQWPSQQSVMEEARSTCRDLFAEFEQWADRRGYSLEPGFRRREIQPSPLGVDTETRERIRLPLVGLAFYNDDDDTTVLRGVLPCTERSTAGVERTYTVDGWLTTIETRALDEPLCAAQSDQLPLAERQ